MEFIIALVTLIILIGIKLAVLLYVLKKDKQKQNAPKDEDILDQKF